MYDSELAKQISDMQVEIHTLFLEMNVPAPKNPDQADNKGFDALGIEKAKVTRRAKIEMLQRLKQRTNADLARPGNYAITSPKTAIVLSADFRENLLGRNVRPSDPLIRIGYTDPDHPKLADWEIELKIPQKHVGQVFRAFETVGPELDVDVMFLSNTTTSYRAKLRKDKIASQANTQKDDNNETEPVVIAWARVSGDDIPADRLIPTNLLLSGSEVHTRIRCGDRPMGYSLFYGVYEFAYEKVIFPYYWK
jgi:hypothetical protein